MHIFYSCPMLIDTIQKYRQKYVPAVTALSDADFKRFLFTGIRSDGSHDMADRVINLFFLYEIWYCKTHRKLPSFSTIDFNLCNNLDSIIECNNKLKMKISKSNNVWCRTWRERHGAGNNNGRG